MQVEIFKIYKKKNNLCMLTVPTFVGSESSFVVGKLETNFIYRGEVEYEMRNIKLYIFRNIP